MRCCAPFCRNAPHNVPGSQEGRRISFHGFPSDARLCAAWLRALGKQGAPLPEPAVVCSQHFLDDDIHETESGSRQIDNGAIPSTVLVCMMCLDTDGKMFLMSKHKLDEAYEYLTGYAPCNQGNLKQTLCAQCAQRLLNFIRFRDQSLRARALMMDLVEKHELITRRHIKMINRTKHRLKSPMVVTTLGADFCDLHIQEDGSDDKLTESEATIDTCVVKTEESDDSIAVGEDMDVIYEKDDNTDSANNDTNEDDGDADNVNNEIKEDNDNTDFVALHDENISDESIMLDAKLLDDALLRALQKKPAIVDQVAKIQDLLKFESADFTCSLCSEEFVQELAYMEHVSMHAQSGSAAGESGMTEACERHAAGPSLPSLAEIRPDTAGPLHRPDSAGLHDGRARANVAHTSDVPLSACVASSNDSEEHLTEEADAGPSSEQAITTVSGDLDCRSSDSNSRTNDVFGKKDIDASSAKTRIVFNSCDSNKSAFKNMSYESKSQNEVPTRKYIEPVTAEEQVNEPKSLQIKAVCLNNDITKQFYHSSDSSFLIEDKMYICDFCRVMFKRKSLLVKHVHSHATVNRLTCEFCGFICKYKSSFSRHMRSHTGEKPYSCKFCEYKAAIKSHLTVHMRKHTGEKPYSCKLCEYKAACKHSVVVHMRIHTGAKPYNCKLCEFQTAQSGNLVVHMKRHTGENLYLSKLSENKSEHSGSLIAHMRKNTGKKRYSCKLCEYKAACKSHLVVHMRHHAGEKPYSCKLCSYKSDRKSDIVIHMRTHAGEKPYSCQLCEYKTTHRAYLIVHMRKHTGEKPYSCELCEFKTAHPNVLTVHMKKHTGEKPYSCKLCEYKAAQKISLLVHMRNHTGEKPYSCKLCKYTSARKGFLLNHMKNHTGENSSCE